MSKIKLHIICIITALSLLNSCIEESKNTEKKFKVFLSINTSKLKINSTCNFLVESAKKTVPDSVFYILNGTRIKPIYETDNSYSFNLATSKLGKTTIPIELFHNGEEEKHSVHITVISDIVPINKSYKVIKSYPHDSQAYTQGLVYTNGELYEGTGQYTISSLRKIAIETGNIIDSIKLSSNLFGEGITIMGDSIFQLTWKAQKGFVYNKNFQKITEFTYNTEGWGITNNDLSLIVSDGSEYLYFYNPRNFELEKRIPVYNNLGPISKLNELEYINGYIYANIYTTDIIVKIDPQTGKVLEQIDLHGILSPSFYHENIDVLNGIAYDAEENRIFVTGKNWPRLFEVEFIDKVTK